MRQVLRNAATATTLMLAVSAGAALAPAPAFSQAAKADDADAKQVPLTQKQIDALIAAQAAVAPIMAKAPGGDAGKPDPKVEAQVDAAIKKSGFADEAEYTNVSYSVGMVLAGIDPDTGKYVGATAATQKQIDEVKADKKMPPKEKKEALDELEASLKSAPTDKPMQANIDIVTANLDKLNKGMQQAD